MATSAGKTIALILLIALVLLIGWRLTPLAFSPFGFLSTTITAVKNGWENTLHSLNIWPNKFFRVIPASFLSLVLLIIWIFVIVWVYRDAERRGMNGILWALLVFIGNIIGLLIYLIVRSDNVPSKREPAVSYVCPSCGKSAPQKYAFCPHCGASMLGDVCPDCKKPIEKGWLACPHCGKKLDSQD
jgi:DNA-directed RNA polymerase subunit RPC12/RpoP